MSATDVAAAASAPADAFVFPAPMSAADAAAAARMSVGEYGDFGLGALLAAHDKKEEMQGLAFVSAAAVAAASQGDNTLSWFAQGPAAREFHCSYGAAHASGPIGSKCPLCDMYRTQRK
ncbi:Hypothetical protein UVM_LOCUS281 [uncultured virus]|nr:Hypothetical protein UVM_LOCUS281 [uncultured virus]